MTDPSLFPMIQTFLAQKDPFDKLPEALLNTIAGHIEIVYLTTGEQLPPEQLIGYGLYLVRTGAVEQRHTADNSLRARLATGDIFGFSQLMRSATDGEQYQVTAIENSLLYCIPKATLISVMENSAELRAHFAHHEGNRLASAILTPTAFNDDIVYLKQVSSVLNSQMAIVAPTVTIRQTAQQMVEQHRSSALIMDGQKLLGIITDRDLTKRVVATGVALDSPVSTVMTVNPVTIEYHASVLTAVEMMMQHNVRSLPVTRDKQVVGVVTATSLVVKNSVQAIYLISRIYRQENLAGLKALTLQRQAVFESLVESAIHPRQLQQMMTLIADAFNKRLLQLAERQFGPAPCAYAWFVAGSQARHEIHLNSDQDNALILERTPQAEEISYFRQLADYVCYGLAECGYPLCPGHIMATNPRWCQSLTQWQQQYQQWIIHSDPESLLNASIFLDLRFLYGAKPLFHSLQQSITPLLKNNGRFLRILAANSLRVSPPLGMFRQFVLVKNGDNLSVFNIKKQAVNLIVELSRLYALDAGTLLPGTADRLQYSAEHQIISHATHKELLKAFDFINNVRSTHQLQSLKASQPVSNHIAPDSLTQFERNHLKDAFRIIARTQEAIMQRYGAKGVLQ
ncbi:DUF294 nucleotidyltransferase-like domain-containing protein [Pragia fontium]|uniref:DUF294 nucleotidyltransferase-like domain-containing protein n=1 Tax=Pragia fontium TaxID=82985 RepID=UPI00064A79C4|nr:DUF294 nucleotidyltransferase-like domain-containing protein [Pragia fontium]AKJ40856.1 cyclic nucleotide-binding protein [Pragia fontium]